MSQSSRYVSVSRHESSDSEADSDLEVLSQCSDSAVDYQQSAAYPSATIRDGSRHIPSREPKDHTYDLRPRSKPKGVPTRQRPHQSRPKSVLLPVPSTQSHRVRFEEALEADATGPMSRIRKRLNKENRKHSRQKEVSSS